MLINGGFMIEEQLFISTMRHSHDIDVPKFRPRFTPVAMRQNMVTAHLAAHFNFTTRRHRPMKQRVEPRDADAAR